MRYCGSRADLIREHSDYVSAAIIEQDIGSSRKVDPNSIRRLLNGEINYNYIYGDGFKIEITDESAIPTLISLKLLMYTDIFKEGDLDVSDLTKPDLERFKGFFINKIILGNHILSNEDYDALNSFEYLCVISYCGKKQNKLIKFCKERSIILDYYQ